MAYLALPRLHRILSNMYVPNIYRQDANGGRSIKRPCQFERARLGRKLHKAMTEAGWVLADGHNSKVSLENGAYGA